MSYACYICKKKFKSISGLSNHIRKSHDEITLEEYYNKFLSNGKKNPFCEECGKPVKFLSLTLGYDRYCHNPCPTSKFSIQKRRQTCLKKYGVEHPAQSDLVKEKAKETCLKKYGSEYYVQTDEWKEKSRNTCLKKYGKENVMQNSEVQQKSKETCLRNHGVEHPSQSPTIRQKIKKSFLKKYGQDHPLKVQKFKEKAKQTCVQNYGVQFPGQSKTVQQKIKESSIKNYGTEYPCQSEKVKNKIKAIHEKKFRKNLEIYLNELELELLDSDYNNAHFLHIWKCKKCGTQFRQIWNAIQQGYLCPKCYPRNNGSSKQEKEIVQFIQSLDPNIEIILNSRSVIEPYEVDIFIPSKKLAIEYDGLYWHSEQTGTDPNYHLKKTELCEKQGIQLIHIFEDEWFLKKSIVKSRIAHILKLNKEAKKIGARQCQIKEIGSKQKNEFLEKYHLQGKDSSLIKLGAFYDQELVAVMTFSHGSLAKGVKQINKEVWELNRFCIHSNYIVSGIANKLLSYFKRNCVWTKIFSYADRRWSVGNVYRNLGFELVSKTGPNYWYHKNFVRIHRFNLRKQKHEPKEIPEHILRLKEGYTRIWDCGHLKYETKKGDC